MAGKDEQFGLKLMVQEILRKVREIYDVIHAPVIESVLDAREKTVPEALKFGIIEERLGSMITVDNKYIVLNEMDPIIFPSSFVHKQIADMFVCPNRQVTSAGFFDISIHRTLDGDFDARLVVFGESVSLKMVPGPFDSLILRKLLFGR